MGEEYRKWLEAHPNATEKERQEAWDRYMKKLEARRLVGEMLLALRNS